MYRYLHLFILLGLTLVCQQVKSQFSIELVDSSRNEVSFRGLSVVTDKVVWVSGSKGTVGLSKDGGKNWKWMQIPGFEKSDFRDIEGFDKNTAIIMASGTPAVILKTTDGGENWKVVFRDNRPEMFLDAMDFWDEKRGMLVGDPINGRFVLLETTNGGDGWRVLDSTLCPEAHDSEAVFAASGTSLVCFDKNKIAFVSGGKTSRLFKCKLPFFNWQTTPTNQMHGASSQGCFSVAYCKWLTGGSLELTGGDYLKPDSVSEFQVVSMQLNLRGFSISNPAYSSIGGYRSCIAQMGKRYLIATGTNGTDILLNGRWRCISRTGFNVVCKAKNGKAVFLAGSKGRIAKLMY